MPSELVANAAELIALDVRFDDWFLHIAKRSASDARIEELLQMSDDVTTAIETAWARFDAAESAEKTRSLGDLLSLSIAKFRQVLQAEIGASPR